MTRVPVVVHRRGLARRLALATLLGTGLMVLLAEGPRLEGTGVPATAARAGVRSTSPLPAVTRAPLASYPVPVNIDGCDHDYGVAGQCVPWTFPPGTSNGCTWLREHGFGPLLVAGTDRLRLDTDHDGIACDAADG